MTDSPTPTDTGKKLTPLLADLPLGDGPKRANIRLRKSLSSIARRVAMKALLAGREDILLEVYAAGLSHACELGDAGLAALPKDNHNG